MLLKITSGDTDNYIAKVNNGYAIGTVVDGKFVYDDDGFIAGSQGDPNTFTEILEKVGRAGEERTYSLVKFYKTKDGKHKSFTNTNNYMLWASMMSINYDGVFDYMNEDLSTSGLFVNDKVEKDENSNSPWRMIEDYKNKTYVTDVKLKRHTTYVFNVNQDNVVPFDEAPIEEVAKKPTFDEFLRSSGLNIKAATIDEANVQLKNNGVARGWNYQYITETPTGYEVKTYDDGNFADWLGVDPDSDYINMGTIDAIKTLDNGEVEFFGDSITVYKDDNGNYFKANNVTFDKISVGNNVIVTAFSERLDNQSLIHQYIAARLIPGVKFNDTLLMKALSNKALAKAIAQFEATIGC